MSRPRSTRSVLTASAVAFATMIGVFASLPSASAAPTAAPVTAGAARNVCPTVPAAGHMTCLMQVLPRSGAARPMSTTPGGSRSASYSNPKSAGFAGYTPTDLRAAYGIPATNATTLIAVVDAFGNSAAQSHLDTYRSAYRLPACDAGCFTKVDQNGTTNYPADDIGWAQETDLDLQMASAVCPTCRLLLVETASDSTDDLLAGVARATALGARYVSMSWGGTEQSPNPDDVFSTTGATYVAAGGDNNYAAGPMWPATSPAVVAVGGTSLFPASNLRGWTEQAWHTSASVGTGSACSGSEAQPSWQSAVAAIRSVCARRAANDVSMVGDPDTGMSIYTFGGWAIAGGTSASTPMIAALAAMTGETNGTSAAGYAYSHPAGFTDVTADPRPNACRTRLCTAVAGWDGPTGIGTPYGLGGFGTVIGPAAATVTVHRPGTVTSRTGTPVSIDVHAADSAGRAVSYAVSGAPAGVSVTGSGRLTGRPARPGRYTVIVAATDSAGYRGATQFTWVVLDHTLAPSGAARLSRAGASVRVGSITWHSDSAHGARVRPSLQYRWFVNGKAVRAGSSLPVSKLATGRKSSVRAEITATLPHYTTTVVKTATVTVSR